MNHKVREPRETQHSNPKCHMCRKIIYPMEIIINHKYRVDGKEYQNLKSVL
jgi:hypothetical protein